jgi:hypothetical protein
MNTSRICSVMLLATGVAAGTIRADPAADVIGQVREMDQVESRATAPRAEEQGREFVLDERGLKTLKRGAHTKAFRVCMTESEDAVPLKVLHDGLETIVDPGECSYFEATKIRIAGAKQLNGDTLLVGQRRFDSTIYQKESVASARSGPRFRK